jgi:DUF971 family protein
MNSPGLLPVPTDYTMNPIPKAITVNKPAHVLEITWNDGSLCRYPLSELREACPCVECRGGHANMGREHDPAHILVLKPKRSYGLEKIDLVGNYALMPTWDDGHHTGIYTWDYLRRLCPPENAPAQDAADAAE